MFLENWDEESGLEKLIRADVSYLTAENQVSVWTIKRNEKRRNAEDPYRFERIYLVSCHVTL